MRKDFPCHFQDCNVVCSFKSNIFRHYKNFHQLEKDEIPLAIIRLKREKKPRKPCPTCGKGLTQLSNHKSKVKPLISAQPALKAVSVSLEKLSDKILAKFNSKIAPSIGRITRSTSKINYLEQSTSTSTGRITRSGQKQAPKAVESLDRRSKTESSSSSSSASSASAHESSDEDDDDGDDSDVSHDSIAKPKPPPKKVEQKKGVSLPPRTATWRSPSDIPQQIKDHIRKTYEHYQFSKIMDHQVRRQLAEGSFDHRIYEQLVINSVGRCGVDAINLIKLVYDDQRSRPIYKSPARK